MRAIRLLKDERGANAIEYSLIGAFLGIGIIAALSGTKTSLNSTYTTLVSGLGTVASGGSSGSTPAVQTPASPPAPTNSVTSQRAVAAANTSSRYSYWSGKTLTGKAVTNPTSTSQQTVFSYADGTSGTYLVNYDSTGKLVSEVVTTNPYGFAGRTADALQFTFGADGTQQSMVYSDRYANGVTRQISTSAASNGWAEYVRIYDQSGNLTSQGANGNTGSGVISNGGGDEVYFRALANQ